MLPLYRHDGVNPKFHHDISYPLTASQTFPQYSFDLTGANHEYSVKIKADAFIQRDIQDVC